MIWIIGAKGMLGRELCQTLKKAELKFIGTDKEVDILSPNALAEKAEEITPDWIVNCSAYTAVDNAEDDSEMAFKINRDGVRNIAEVAKKLDIPLVHISTDYVFDGTSDVPLAEEAQIGPIGVYGKSKLAGEEMIQKICSKYFIIRTAWLYGQFGSNFVYTMLKLMNKLDSIKVVDDQIGSPTWTRDLTDLIAQIVKMNSIQYGIYHFSGEGQCSWFDFANEIYRLGREKRIISSVCKINPCTAQEFPTPAKRPAYSLLSKKKVKQQFNFNAVDWEKSMLSYVSLLKPIVSRSRQWQELALEDYDSAKYMFEGKRYSYVYFMCQQAVEKSLKALVEFYSLPPKMHNLLKLAVMAEMHLTDNQEFLLMKLFRNYTRMRYPELNRFKPQREETEKILKDTGDFLCLLKTKPMLSVL